MHEYMKLVIKRDFPKYKHVQLAATLTEVEITERKTVSMTRLLGFTIKKEIQCTNRIIPLVEYSIAYSNLVVTQTNRHQIYVGVDQVNKTVYWNYSKLPDKRI